MKEYFLLAMFVVLGGHFMACKSEPRPPLAAIPDEYGVYEGVSYTPSDSGTSVGPTMSFSGHIGIGVSSYHISEKWAVSLVGERTGRFMLDGGQDSIAWSLWKRGIKPGSRILIHRAQYYIYNWGNDVEVRVTAIDPVE